MTRRRLAPRPPVLILLLAVCVAGTAAQQASRAQPLVLVRTIPLPRVEGRIDHLAFDSAGHRLFVAALGNNTVEVVDPESGSVRSLPGFHEPQGIATVPDAGQVAIAEGEGEGVKLIDLARFQSVAAIRLGEDSDNARYDAAARRLYVGYGSGAIAAIDPATRTVVGTVKLPAHPESFQLERSGPRMFVNLPDADQIAVVDRRAMKVVATWPMTTAKANFPMALDETGHRLFVGCRRPARVLVYDTVRGAQVDAFPAVGDTDDLFYDEARTRLYVSGGEGFVDAFQGQPTGRFERLARISTADGARTSLFVREQSRLYVAVPHRGRQPAEIRAYDAR